MTRALKTDPGWPTSTKMLRAELRSYRLSLSAANKAPRTIQSYMETAQLFADYLSAEGVADDLAGITRKHVREFLVELEERGHSAATRLLRYKSLRQFFKWAVDEEEIEVSPMLGVKPPVVPEKPVPVVNGDDLELLLKTCSGKTFADRRDTALISLMYDTGLRVSEVVAIEVDDIDLDEKCVTVLGKGRKTRTVPFGVKTARAIDRYVRMRDRKSPTHDYLWLGQRGAMRANTVWQMLQRRAEQAGIEHVHPHMFRHTFAHEYLSDGGNEGDLMKLAGWKNRNMLDRYGASAAEERARAAYRSPLDRKR